IHRRAEYAYDQIMTGTSLEDIVSKFDDDRIAEVEKNAGVLLSGMVGEPVSIKVRRIEPAARRTSKLAQKYWSFDPLVDITVTVGDNVAEMDGFVMILFPGL
ncbi:hypothetical protein, partial [Eubacterium callanderi]|uniref:hypothetical protein n=1 Tax=Eubacterium callanderi TaxID=53442 RepID=UPI00210C43B2